VIKTTRSSVYYVGRKGPFTALRQRMQDPGQALESLYFP